MAKSRETFNKKEKEKQKLRKKKEKDEKKKARKESSGKGLSFEDMLAYVDENGNITSRPPDPTPRKEIALEDIQISVSRSEDLPETETTRQGVVLSFNDSKGFGFIKDLESQETVFVHVNGLIDRVKLRDKVSFTVRDTPKGPNAIEVRVIK